MEIILGSASPRRKELLALLGYPFEVVVKDVAETINDGSFAQIVMDIARQKAVAFDGVVQENQLVICGDTIVVANDEILTKPKDEKDAYRMLKLLSNNVHEVYSGVAILYQGQFFSFYEKTKVEFVKLANQEIKDYIATGEPFDKAGAYGIQGHGALFVKRIEGDYYNVVGLPVCQLNAHLKDILSNNCTYILRTKDNTLYTGWTNDIQKRLKAHNRKVASKYTRAKTPVELVYLERAFNKSQAMSREAKIKKLTRKQKEELILAQQLELAREKGYYEKLFSHFNFNGVDPTRLGTLSGLDSKEITELLQNPLQSGVIVYVQNRYRFNYQKNLLESYLGKI